MSPPTSVMSQSRLRVILLAMLVTVLGLVVGSGVAAGSGGASGGGPVAVSQPADTIVIRDFAFLPSALTVAPGTTIRVSNQDRAPHTVTANDRSFDSGTIAGGQRGEITAPRAPGTYPYICTLHPEMTGTLIVQ